MDRPVFPLPLLSGLRPLAIILDPRDPGVELSYERSPSGQSTTVRSATRATTLYGFPRRVPVFACVGGTVVYAREHSDGYTAIVSHGAALVFYSRLDELRVPETDGRLENETQLQAGDVIGAIGGARHLGLHALHFEIWRANIVGDFEEVDLLQHLHRWRTIGWPEAGSRASPAATAA